MGESRVGSRLGSGVLSRPIPLHFGCHARARARAACYAAQVPSVARELDWLQRAACNRAKVMGVDVMLSEAGRVTQLEQLVEQLAAMRAETSDAREMAQLASAEVAAQRALALIHDMASKRATKELPAADAEGHARVLARVLSALDAHPSALADVRAALEADEH